MNYKSLNLKISLILIIFGAFLLTILFALVIPKMEKQRKDHTTKQIENMITLTTHQIKLATKAIQESGRTKAQYIKSLLTTKMETAHDKLEELDNNDKENYLKTASKDLGCNLYILDDKKDIAYRSSNDYLNKTYIKEDDWNIIRENKQTICPKASKQIIYSKSFHSNTDLLVLKCSPKILRSAINFESKLKKDIQHSFSLTKDMHKGKIYLMWINSNEKNNKQVLYQNNDDRYYNNKYCVSKISNFDFPKTGLLSGKEILDAMDNEPIKHLLDKENDKGNYIYPALTWVRSIEHTKNKDLLFITTVLEEDFHSNEDSSFWKILPTSLFALFGAILVGLFLLRRLFKTMNILANTAKEVNDGNLNIRTHIKGKDDIGLLGTTFDSMLDTIEKDIEVLDKKVEQRTSELQASLDEKEILLREIHHRVKNNLAMTIELIKIQKIKLKDSTTKIALGDIQERIYVMELLHRKLYESKNLSTININKYIKELVDDIKQSYENDKEVEVEINIKDSYFMDIDYALPCGLIINECLTNSFKHAFENQKGKIKLSLFKKDTIFNLQIEDNGKGIDKDIDIHKSKSLGLRLISSIAKSQLLGSIEYKKENGVCFIVRFEV